MEPKARHRTRYGEGTFKYVPKRNLWIGRYDTGERTVDGKRIIVSASSRDEDEAWNRFQAKKKDAMLKGPPTPGTTPNQTVERWSREWLQRHEQRVRHTTFQADRANLTNWINPVIGRVRLEMLTAAHMDRVGDAALDAGRSDSTAHSAQRTLTKMLKQARAYGYQIPDMIFEARKVSLGQTGRTAMTRSQVETVLRRAHETMPDAVRWWIAIIYGARRSEILGLTWDRIHINREALARGDLVCGWIDIAWQLKSVGKRADGSYHLKRTDEAVHVVDSWHFLRPKTDAGDRRVPLIRPVALGLQAWQQVCPQPASDLNPWGLVFPRITGMAHYRGYPRNWQADSAEWKQLLADAKVRKPGGGHYVPHEARHSMISILKDSGVPDHLIEALVGQTKLVDSYVHPDMQATGQALASAFKGLLPDA